MSHRSVRESEEPDRRPGLRDVDAAARARMIRIGAYAAGPGGLAGFLGGAYAAESLLGGLLGFIGGALGVGLAALALTEGSGWVFSRLHNPSGASTPRKQEFSRAEALAVGGQPEKAIRAYEVFVLENPDDPTPYLRIARILRDELGRHSEAVRWFQRARKEAEMSRGEEALLAREIVEIYRDRLDQPVKAAPELARMRERFAGTPHGEWARAELREVKELIRHRMDEPPGSGPG